MLKRRSILAMLGMAPVAAATAPIEAAGFGSAAARKSGQFGAAPSSFSPPPLIANDVEDVTPLYWAQRKVAALRWMDANGVEDDMEGFLASHEEEVNAMRSWSPTYRAMAMKARARKAYRVRRMDDALGRVRREMKLAMAPDWVRRFL